MATHNELPKDAHLVADQGEVAVFLEDPATHGGRPVERINTHAAMVFLAGERAYKIKRAVKYPYMDFSTLARREWACKREIELNCRTAPSLYLRAVPISRAPDGRLELGGDKEVVEWAVEMVRFDQADLFDRMAHDGKLTAALMTEDGGHHRPVPCNGGSPGLRNRTPCRYQNAQMGLRGNPARVRRAGPTFSRPIRSSD